MKTAKPRSAFSTESSFLGAQNEKIAKSQAVSLAVTCDSREIKDFVKFGYSKIIKLHRVHQIY